MWVRVRFCIGSRKHRLSGLSVVFCSMQSLKIHLMLPPYAINYHFCLTLCALFPSVLSATKQSRSLWYVFFFFFCKSATVNSFFFFCKFSFICCGWYSLYALVSSRFFEALQAKSQIVDRLYLAIVEFHIVHKALIYINLWHG